MSAPLCRGWASAFVLAVAVWAGPALAAPFAVESPGHADRGDAEALRKAAIDAGASADRTRIVRRYERGAGWRYLVHVDGLDSDAGAQKVAAVLSSKKAGAAVITDLSTNETVQTAAPPPPPPPAATPAAPVATSDTPTRRARREAEAVLRAAVDAHGGAAGGLALVDQADAISFRFVRHTVTPSGEVIAKHRYSKRGKAVRLDVQVQKGAGVDSVTVVAPDGGAWVRTDGEVVPRDTERAREILTRFGPDQLLRLPLSVAYDIETAEAWRNLVIAGPEGDDLIVMRPRGGPAGGLVEVAFARSDGRLRRMELTRQGRSMTYHYDRYSEVSPGLWLPQEARMERDGAVVERIAVSSLEVNGEVPALLFTLPGEPQP